MGRSKEWGGARNGEGGGVRTCMSRALRSGERSG